MIDKIIIWGHKLHSHTHSYIHFGFYRAFKHMGFNVLWLDETKDNITNALFITEGQVDGNIPLDNSNVYLLHNCNVDKYKNIKNKFNLQVLTKSDLDRYKFDKLDDFTYYQNNLIIMMWATDLLPYEINNNIYMVKNNKIKSKNIINFVGMPLYPWDEVKLWCDNNNIIYKNYGGFSNNVSMETNIELIQESILAPAIQCEWQVKNGYVPCRIFKNISYGKMGLTNNYFVYDFVFNKKIIYDNDIHKLLDKGINCNNNNIIELMEYVRDNHTYINRINSIFLFLKKNNINYQLDN